jgi:hypothetical protein
MRVGGVAVLLGITAFLAYSLGHQSAPVSNQPAALIREPSISTKPVAVNVPSVQPYAAVISPPPAIAHSPDISARPDSKRKVEAALTAAAIAVIIVKASRDQYYATGHPCACPNDSMRNGRACGGRSAYSRPGGAAPLCSPSDVTATMVESYRQAMASR